MAIYQGNPSGGRGSFYGFSPKKMTGKVYIPQHLYSSGATVTVTATRLYFTPFVVDQATTFAGAKVANQGAGDNTETLRLGVYSEAAAGGPGALQKDFGQITLTAAAAERTAANAVTLAAGVYYLAQHYNTAMAMFGMDPVVLGTAEFTFNPFSNNLGSFGLLTSTNVGINMEASMYVDTAYGALAATAVTPTASNTSRGASTPLMGLYI